MSAGSVFLGKTCEPYKLPGDDEHFVFDALRLGLRLLENLVGRDAGVQLEFEFLGEQLLADAPFAGGARQHLALQEFLMLFERGDHRPGGVAHQPAELRHLASQLEDAAFIVGDAAPRFCRNAVSTTTRGGFLRLTCAGVNHARNILHAGHVLFDILRPRQRGLRQQAIGTIRDVFVVDARVEFEAASAPSASQISILR